MSTIDWIGQLQQILNCPVSFRRYSITEWRKNAGIRQEEITAGYSLESTSTISYVMHANDNWIEILEVKKADGLSDKEKALIRLTIQTLYYNKKSTDHSVSGSEAQAKELGKWIVAQLNASEAEMLPNNLTMGGRLLTEWIPFLIVNEQSSGQATSYEELKRLLDSFMSDKVLLIPLTKFEWLVLGTTTLLKETESDEKGEEEEETEEESLRLIGLGLREMLASEWVGDCHIAVSRPISPVESLIETIVMLRETIQLGRKFHVGTNIHLPWKLHLERLLSSIPEESRLYYVEQVLNRTDFIEETETISTLETFFALNCNVSETAKKLYIHRNTLLYRLDKLKQETGLDVRVFRDAVLVKMIILLCKMTKSV